MKKLSSLLLFSLTVFVLIISTCIFALGAEKLPAVEELSASTGENEYTLKWKPIGNADGYKIYLFSEDDYKTIAVTKSAQYKAKKLTPDTDYTVAVRAFTLKDGKRQLGTVSKKLTVKTKLAAVSGLSAIKASESTIKIQWLSNESVKSYQIYISPTGKSDYALAGETKKTRFIFRNLDGKTGYKIRLRARSKDNKSKLSDSVVFYTQPKPVKKVKTKSKENSSVQISWEKQKLATGYLVYARKAKDKFKQVADVKNTSFTYKAPESEQSYGFVVKVKIETKHQTLRSKSCAEVFGKSGKVKISLSKTSLRKGEYIDVISEAKVVTLSSSNTSVIRVDGKRLYACGVGSAVVTAKSKSSVYKFNVRTTGAVVNNMSCVYDVTNSKMVFGNRLNERCYPGSITKLITALVTLKYMSVNDTIYVGDELNLVEPLSSRCNIYKGEKFRLGDLLYGLLLPSGGDAAYTIAVNCARKVSGNPSMGYVAAKNYFVSLMNSYMKSIGATGTHCANPHGYPNSSHYSTVNDLLLVARRILKNPTLKSVTGASARYVTALTGKGRYWSTTNGLLVRGGSFYSPYAHGMKTGTVETNYTGIVSAATKNGRTIITIAVGCESYNARYNATHRLYNYYLY